MPTLDAPVRQRNRERKVEIFAQNENWFTLTCSCCHRLFDVPRSRSRLREQCEECRQERHARTRAASRARSKH